MPADAPPPGERRKLQRHPQHGSPVTFTAPPAEPGLGRLYNLSIQGIGILVRQYFPTGTWLRIHVPANSGNAASFLPAEVRHATAQADGSWLLGCALFRFLTVGRDRGIWVSRLGSGNGGTLLAGASSLLIFRNRFRVGKSPYHHY